MPTFEIADADARHLPARAALEEFKSMERRRARCACGQLASHLVHERGVSLGVPLCPRCHQRRSGRPLSLVDAHELLKRVMR